MGFIAIASLLFFIYGGFLIFEGLNLFLGLFFMAQSGFWLIITKEVNEIKSKLK